MSDWYEDFVRRQNEKMDQACNGPKRAEVMQILSESGVSRAEVSFDGSGDSGQVEEIRLYDKVGGRIRSNKSADAILKRPIAGSDREVPDWSTAGTLRHVVRPETVEERIESLCYDLLSGGHPGWEINEGSFGQFVIEPANNEIHLTFNERIETYETTEEDY